MARLWSGSRSWSCADLIGVKPGDHEAFFAAVQVRWRAGPCEEMELTDARGVECGYRLVNALPLNQAHPGIRVNSLEYWEVEGEKVSLRSPALVMQWVQGGKASGLS
jgi:hypothetical protein